MNVAKKLSIEVTRAVIIVCVFFMIDHHFEKNHLGSHSFFVGEGQNQKSNQLAPVFNPDRKKKRYEEALQGFLYLNYEPVPQDPLFSGRLQRNQPLIQPAHFRGVSELNFDKINSHTEPAQLDKNPPKSDASAYVAGDTIRLVSDPLFQNDPSNEEIVKAFSITSKKYGQQ